jgi:hypothetical protein
MPQTLSGSSSANPRSQSVSYCPTEIQFTTRAMTLPPVGSRSERTVVPTARADRIELHTPEGLPESPRMSRKAA